MVKVLVVEDEASIREMIALNLRLAGMEAVEADSAEAALPLLEQKPGCDAAILDVMLPGMNGFSLCETIRRTDQKIGIIILSAKGQEQDKIRGLSIGADDYMTKPFDSGELLARVRAALRVNRYGGGSLPGGVFSAQGLTINYERRKVFADGQEVRLTQTEYNIMAFLSVHAGKVLTYAAIIRAVWGYSDYGSVKKLQVNMKNIRKKMGVTPGEKRYIINELGVGYRMLAEDEA